MNVAFIGLAYHFKNTKSTQFLIQVLTDFYGKVEVAANEDTWDLLPRRNEWDLVVFFQHIPKRWELDSLKAKAVVLVPMYDNCRLDRASWSSYRDCKILCFSSTLHGLLTTWGHDTHLVQYFPPLPAQAISWAVPSLSAFFWPRRPELHWNHIRQLLEHGAVGSVHLHLTEATSLPTAEETTQWNITTSRWFEQPSDYAVLLQRFQIYFAPRRFEGIGMSFLEAMALGMAVVAPNNPTMNEYLVSGHNGFLYDPEHPQVPNWQKAEQWGAAARQTCVDGRQTWLDSLPALRAWLEREPKRFGGMAFSLRRSLAILRTRLRLVKRWVLSPRTDA